MSTRMTLAPMIRDLSDSPDVEHGVHVPCQIESDYVLAACGMLLDWVEGYIDGSRDPMCEACLAVERCPVCGVKFVAGGWR